MSIYAAMKLPIGLDQTLSVPKVSQFVFFKYLLFSIVLF